MEGKNGLMTHGNIAKQLIVFAIPLLVGNLFQQLYNTVDSIVVGNFIGDQALAAVNSSGPIIDMLVSFFMGLSLGAGVLISNYFGAQDCQGVKEGVHTAMALALVSSLITTIVGVIFTPIILKWVRVDSSVIGQRIINNGLYRIKAGTVIDGEERKASFRISAGTHPSAARAFAVNGNAALAYGGYRHNAHNNLSM